MEASPDLRFIRMRLRLTAEAPIHLPPYAGSVFRGGFGAALRRTCCTMTRKECRDCMLGASCVYASVFETGAGHVRHSRYALSSYPRPFVIEPPFPCPVEIRAGESFSCHLVLMGKAADQLPYFIFAFSELGKMGIGSSQNGRPRGRYRIETADCVMEDDGKTVFDGRSQTFVGAARPRSFDSFGSYFAVKKDGPARVRLCFETPTRIKHKNRLTKDLSFELLMRNMLRRLSLLVEVCAGESWDLDYAGILEKAREVETSRSALVWYDWKRYSRRQHDAMSLGGFVGEIDFQGDLAPFLPFVRLGEYFHMGKACTFGLGKYRSEVPSHSPKGPAC